MKKIIDEMYAFVAIDPEDGSEGIIGINVHGQWFPFVGADMDRVKSLLPLAKDICVERNISFRVLKFTNKTDITKDLA